MSTDGRAELRITVDPASIEAFAAFSGDRSSLHTDAAFASRSLHGSIVVHGMLPVVLLPLVLQHLVPGSSFTVRRVRGRFMHPILPHDRITIRCSVDGTTDGVTRVLYEVVQEISGTIATRGSLDLIATDAGSATTTAERSDAVVSGRLLEREERFDDLRIGQESMLPFSFGAEQYRAYTDLVQTIVSDEASASADVPARYDAPMFAMLAATSTLVGMVMPGRSATFQEFELAREEHAPNDAANATLHSTLKHRSAATNTIVQDITFTTNAGPVARGKLSASVARAPFRTPPMEELAARSLDHGLTNKVVVITGSARGLGATTAKLFAVHGARVVINYRNSDAQAQALVREIIDFGGQAIAVQADVTRPEQVGALMRNVLAHWGTVDIVVNNAAGNFRPIPFEGTTWERVQEDIDVIVKGAFLTAQAAIPIFLRQGGGCIVNISSVAADTPPQQQTKYVIAKSALNGLTRSLAVEFADRNIRVNMVVPSFVETDLTSGTNAVALGKLKAGSPMKRLADPREIAEAVLFLASQRSTFTTGQKLMVTGGLPPFH